MNNDEARVERVAQAISHRKQIRAYGRILTAWRDPSMSDPYIEERLEDARAAIAAATAWQPIETAPKDGTPMLLCRWDSDDQDTLPIVSGFWSRLSEFWFCEMSGHKVNPTHWMPKPEPPK